MRINRAFAVALAGVASTLCGLALAATPAVAAIGIERAVVGASNQDGTPDVQAGSHPYALTTTFVLEEAARYSDNLKDLSLELPPGFVGDPTATPRCAYEEFVTAKCSNEDAVGIATTYFSVITKPGELDDTTDPVYNLVAPPGVPAEFGYIVASETPVLLESTVRTGSDYGLTTKVMNISQTLVVAGSKVTLWGDPASSAHDDVRGGCVSQVGANIETEYDGLAPGEQERESTASPPGSEAYGEVISAGDCPSSTPQSPLLINPTSCEVPRDASLSMDGWQEPGVFSSKTFSMREITGCEKLNFSPTITVKPDGTAGSTPTGLDVELHVPQEGTENPAGLADADVRDTTVTLPQGFQLSPSAADGLQACSQTQIGYTGMAELDPTSEPGIETAQFTAAAPACPEAAKLANVKIKTPLLEGELEGEVYLAAPQNFVGTLENPFGSLVALYLVAEEPVTGVLVKLPGKISLSPETGQITATFENTPQLPFSLLKLEFYGTDRAPLATPALCGSYVTTASFTPWSGGPAATATSSSAITSGPEVETASGPQGTPCSDPLPFSPTLASGTTNVNAGSYTPLDTTISREDGQQSMQSVVLHYPPGLSGILKGIPLCPEVQANAGTCGTESEIGQVIVSAGLGDDPVSVTNGKVFLTEKYEGAPFGLSIVNVAKAGPFVLQEGKPIVVRAKVEVNPITAALTVTTDASGEHAIPHIIDGIPLQIEHVAVQINRAGFTFNPTSCEKMSVTGTIASAEGASSPVSIPFQVANCASLKFKPSFSASTAGKTSRKEGASLHVAIAYPNEAFGGDANVKEVKVELPKALPSRLSTLQKACVAATFEANPASCPSESVVGHAKAITPILPVPLEGPAYFVSNGGQRFPELVIVLQGYGITIELHGETFISKAGITSSTFKTAPDQPLTSFELTLPEGKDSALAANRNLCEGALTMPTLLVGQNGASFKQKTKIAVSGCKPEIHIVGHSIKGTRASIDVKVPSAGTLVASGGAIRRTVKHVGKAKTVAIDVTLSKHDKRVLAKHPHQRVNAKVKLRFTTKSGKRLTKYVKLLLR